MLVFPTPDSPIITNFIVRVVIYEADLHPPFLADHEYISR